MITKTFYAIYDQTTKKFKGRGNISGCRWTEEPTQTYDTEGRATGAMKTHLQGSRWRGWDKASTNLVIKPITVSWEE